MLYNVVKTHWAGKTYISAPNVSEFDWAGLSRGKWGIRKQLLVTLGLVNVLTGNVNTMLMEVKLKRYRKNMRNPKQLQPGFQP